MPIKTDLDIFQSGPLKGRSKKEVVALSQAGKFKPEDFDLAPATFASGPLQGQSKEKAVKASQAGAFNLEDFGVPPTPVPTPATVTPALTPPLPGPGPGQLELKPLAPGAATPAPPGTPQFKKVGTGGVPGTQPTQPLASQVVGPGGTAAAPKPTVQPTAPPIPEVQQSEIDEGFLFTTPVFQPNGQWLQYVKNPDGTYREVLFNSRPQDPIQETEAKQTARYSTIDLPGIGAMDVGETFEGPGMQVRLPPPNLPGSEEYLRAIAPYLPAAIGTQEDVQAWLAGEGGPLDVRVPAELGAFLTSVAFQGAPFGEVPTVLATSPTAEAGGAQVGHAGGGKLRANIIGSIDPATNSLVAWDPISGERIAVPPEMFNELVVSQQWDEFAEGIPGTGILVFPGPTLTDFQEKWNRSQQTPGWIEAHKKFKGIGDPGEPEPDPFLQFMENELLPILLASAGAQGPTINIGAGGGEAEPLPAPEVGSDEGFQAGRPFEGMDFSNLDPVFLLQLIPMLAAIFQNQPSPGTSQQ